MPATLHPRLAHGMPPTDGFLSLSNQVLEEKSGTTCTAAYLWGAGYVDNLVSRTSNSDGNYYAATDANFNVTAIYSPGGTIQERFLYSPYGKRTDLNAGFSASADTKNWVIGWQGLRWDAATAMCHARNRWYSPSLMRWTTWDFIGYGDGMNPNLMEAANPINHGDPIGTIHVELVDKSTDFGGEFNVHFRFALDREAPGDGYIVQKVTETRDISFLSSPELHTVDFSKNDEVGQAKGEVIGKPIVYWEAWHVNKGQKQPTLQEYKVQDDGTWTDNAYGLGRGSSSGWVRQTGEVRFYLTEKCGALGDQYLPQGDKKAVVIKPATGWHFNQTYSNGSKYVVGVGGLTSTDKQPDWWKDGEKTTDNNETVATRSVYVWWNSGALNLNGKTNIETDPKN